jgi:hypothetical protein
MISRLIVAVSLLTLTPGTIARGDATSPAQPYTLWLQGEAYPCSYAVGDVFVQAADLRQILPGEAKHFHSLELLTGHTPPAACVNEVREISRQAGFTSFTAREITASDRAALVPPKG